MTITEVITAFGAYYLNHGQNTASIRKKLIQGFESHQAFTHIVTDEHRWRASVAQHTRILQPFQIQFTPTGTSEFTPVEIQQYHLKADLIETPDTIEASWLGFLSSNDVKRTEWPFIRYWMEQLVVPKINEDLELNEFGRGIYAAPTPGTAGAAGTGMNGILKVIADHVTAGKITPIVLGAVPTTPADFVTYIESFHAAIPLLYRHVPMNVYVPQDYVLRYKRGFRIKYGTNSGFSENDFKNSTVKVLDTNLTLVGLASLNLKANGSANDRFFCTPKSNAIMLSKRLGHKDGTFDIQAVDRSVKLLTDFWIGLGFVIPQLVWVNDGA